MTSTSHHRPIVRALFLGQNGRKIDDPRTKREIKRSSFILDQKDPRSHRETCSLRSKRMRFVAPFPRFGRSVFLSCTGRDDKISQRKTSHSYPSVRSARAHETATIKERTRKKESTQRVVALMNRTLFAKATLLPSAAAVKEEAAIVMRCCVKSEERGAFISSPKRFFFSRTREHTKREKGEEKEIFFSLCIEEEKTLLKEDEQKLFCIFFTRICKNSFRTKTTLSSGTEGQTFCRVFCVCVFA